MPWNFYYFFFQSLTISPLATMLRLDSVHSVVSGSPMLPMLPALSKKFGEFFARHLRGIEIHHRQISVGALL